MASHHEEKTNLVFFLSSGVFGVCAFFKRNWVVCLMDLLNQIKVELEWPWSTPQEVDDDAGAKHIVLDITIVCCNLLEHPYKIGVLNVFASLWIDISSLKVVEIDESILLLQFLVVWASFVTNDIFGYILPFMNLGYELIEIFLSILWHFVNSGGPSVSGFTFAKSTLSITNLVQSFIMSDFGLFVRHCRAPLEVILAENLTHVCIKNIEFWMISLWG